MAEKLEATVKLDLMNSRMKDFYDIWILAREFEFEGEVLSHAIHATFERRQTGLPAGPQYLSAGFSADFGKRQQWQAFVKRGKLRPAENIAGNGGGCDPRLSDASDHSGSRVKKDLRALAQRWSSVAAIRTENHLPSCGRWHPVCEKPGRPNLILQSDTGCPKMGLRGGTCVPPDSVATNWL